MIRTIRASDTLWRSLTATAAVGFLSITMVAGTSCHDQLAASRGGSNVPAPAPTTVTPVGQVSAVGFYAQPVLPDGVKYYFHEQSSLTAPCTVVEGETNFSKQDIYCVLDAEELDLFYNGAGINFNAPPSMCEYTGMIGYAFYAYPPGTVGAVVLTEHKDVNGNIITTTSSNPKVSFDSKGNPVCAYDYTSTNGPNCCEGTWTMTLTQDQSSGPAGVSTVTGGFNGKMGSCLKGPAMNDGMISSDGFPEEKIYRVRNQGQNFLYQVQAPIQQQYVTNLAVANYFSPTDYGAASDNFSQSMASLPLALSAFPASPLPYPISENFPYYRYTCYDAAFEIHARISILIRSWDTVAGFTADNNPYTAGSETNWTTPLSDFLTWHSMDVKYGPNVLPGGTL